MKETKETKEEFGQRYIWWLGRMATQLKDRHNVDIDKLFTVMKEDLDEKGKSVMQEFFLGCFTQGEEPEHCADRILELPNLIADAGIKTDGQAREKGIGNA